MPLTIVPRAVRARRSTSGLPSKRPARIASRAAGCCSVGGMPVLVGARRSLSPVPMTPPSTQKPPRVLLACSGLAHAHRGFESFARDCFDVLRDDPAVEIELIKGSGPPGDRERSVRSLTRDSPLARALGRVSGREPFRFEHAAFALSLQPEIRRWAPDVVYFSEWHTGLGLAALRRLTRGRYGLVLCNGTMAVEGFDHLDRVQQLTPAALETVV